MKRFRITSAHEVFEDDFVNGEGKHVNFYELSETVKAADYKEAVNKYFEGSLLYNLGFENCEVSECKEFLQTSCLVDNDNIQPSSHDVKEWKEGKKVLYANIINIHIEELSTVLFDSVC